MNILCLISSFVSLAHYNQYEKSMVDHCLRAIHDMDLFDKVVMLILLISAHTRFRSVYSWNWHHLFRWPCNRNSMMMSPNGTIFRVTGHLCGEFTEHRWIPHIKASVAELCVFFDLRLNKRLSKQSWGWWFETLLRPFWHHCIMASNKKQQWHRIKNGSHFILCLMALPLLCVYLKWTLMSKHLRTCMGSVCILSYACSNINLESQVHAYIAISIPIFSSPFLFECINVVL